MTRIALSFDDGRKDNYRVAKEIFEPLNIPASFNITTGYIEKNINDVDKPSNHEPMTIDEVKELSKNNLFEIAGHGYKHDNQVENLIYGVDILRKMLSKDKMPIGIASPRSEFDVDMIRECKKDFLNANIAYLRVSKRFKKCSIFRKIIRKINGYFNIPILYYFVYKDTNIEKKDDFILYSVPILKNNKLKEVKYLVKRAIKENKSYIFMLHSILKPNEEYYSDLFSWDYNEFYKLCEFLKKMENENKIKICKVIDMNEKKE